VKKWLYLSAFAALALPQAALSDEFQKVKCGGDEISHRLSTVNCRITQPSCRR
jgi:hypothetical protein